MLRTFWLLALAAFALPAAAQERPDLRQPDDAQTPVTASASSAAAIGPASALAPREIPYQGTLADGGAPVTSATPVVFRLHTAATGGTIAWAESQTVTPDAEGRFTARLGSASSLPTFSEPLWLSVTADGTTLGPRTPLGAVPYALSLYGVRVEPPSSSDDAPAIAAGHPANEAGRGAVVAGGGLVGPGSGSQPNRALGSFSAVSGGTLNTAVNIGSAVGGGFSNAASGDYSAVGGGFENEASGNDSTVGGGTDNDATGRGSTVGGGYRNTASGLESTVAGGQLNTASVGNATVGGGFYNAASGPESTVGGGSNNDATAAKATVGGGDVNTASAERATIGGGFGNLASGAESTVGGGNSNAASGLDATVGGGLINQATGVGSTVGGGGNNAASGLFATVSGGLDNIASGAHASIFGGRSNFATGATSLAAGDYARAIHAGAFVWSDASSTTPFISTGANQFLIDADGGVGILENAPLAELHIQGESNNLLASALENDEIIVEADDAVIGLYSTDGGTWGSALSLGEVDATGDIASKWGIARRTGASGGLYFTFGATKNYAGNDAQMVIETGGTVRADGSFIGGGADLAEYFPLADPASVVAPGQVVGLSGGRVSLATHGAEQIAVISSDPAFIGNPGAETGGALVALVGQVEVRLGGAADVGDLLVASGRQDGTARALAPADYDPQSDGAVLGRVLRLTEAGKVVALVGVDEAAALRDVVSRQANQIDALSQRLARLEALLSL